MASVNYFEQLTMYSQSLLDRLPMKGQTCPLDYLLNDLYGCLAAIKTDETGKIRLLWPCSKEKAVFKNALFEDVPAGLNTTGMLIDRLTILIIKEWHLRNGRMSGKSDEIYPQTKDVIECLTRCTPAKYIINAKITDTKVDVAVTDWEAAYYELLSVNLIIWKSQETLYTKDMEGLPCEDLRAYIRWFSKGNVKRNILIACCETEYWKKIQLASKDGSATEK